jgi:hypothetical protein
MATPSPPPVTEGVPGSVAVRCTARSALTRPQKPRASRYTASSRPGDPRQ